MTARVAWSDDESDILLFEDVDTGSVRVQHHHLDEFDADYDSSITLGEFSVATLQRALIAPVPAVAHAANKRVNPLAWLRRKKDTA